MNIVFVAGLPRSGTTMVQNILDSHSEIFGGPEFDRIPNIIDLRRKLLNSVEKGRIDIYLSHKRVDENVSAFINDCLLNVQTNKKLKFVSEKTPWNILVFKDLIELFPASKFIHVLRNPLDVFESMKKVSERARAKNVIPPDFTQDVNVAISYMLTVYNTMNRLESDFFRNVMTVKYEDILSNLEGQTKRICDFLNVPWEPGLLKFNSLEHPGESTMIGAGVWYSKEMFRQNPQMRTKQEKLMSNIEENLIRTVLHRHFYLTKHQYSIDLPKGLLERGFIKGLAYYYRKRGSYRSRTMRVLN